MLVNRCVEEHLRRAGLLEKGTSFLLDLLN